MALTAADAVTRRRTRRPWWRAAAFPVLSVVVVAAVAAGVAWEAGRNVVATGPTAVAATMPVSRPSGPTVNSIGAGTQPWANQYRDGRLVAQFTADQFDPRKDGSFLVTRPIAILYMRGGGFLRVTGTNGSVAFDAPAGGKAAGLAAAGGMSSPNHGWLRHVRIDQFPAFESARPTLTMMTAALGFDSDTLTVYTVDPQTVDKSAASVPPDDVPVFVRGDDYLFDGYGLTARWDERDGRLLLLLVARGERLVIVNPGKASLPGTETATTATLAGDGNPPRAHGGRNGPLVLPAMFDGRTAHFAAGEDAGGSVGAARPVLAGGVPSRVPPQPPTLYRATFTDAVRVFRGDRRVATADLMSIDFLQGPKPDAATKPAATRPTTVPTAGPSGPGEAALVPQPPPAARLGIDGATTLPSTMPTSKPTTRPTTKPAAEPITVYWTGPLRVAPLRASPAMPVAVGQEVVRLVGTPAVLTPSGPDVATVVKAAVAIYRSGDDALVLDSSPAVPRVDVREARGAHLSAVRVGYDPASSLAVIAGPAEMTVPARAGQTLAATWADRAVLHVVGRGDAVEGVDWADLFGDVVASDPEFDLRSGRLRLDLDLVPAASSKQKREQLKRMTADEAVRCKLPHVGRADRGINAGHLVIDMAPGAGGHDPDPRYLTADGAVHAYDDKQAMDADHVEATLTKKAVATSAPSPGTPGEGRGEGDPARRVPVDARNHPHPNPLPEYRERGPETTTRPSSGPTTEPADAVAIESLRATGHVRATLKSGATADADELRLRVVNGEQVIDLERPTGATVADGKGSNLVGRLVQVAADTGRVTVNTPGTLRHVGGKGGRPVDVAWAGSLVFDPAANVADLRDAVTVTSTSADGTATRVVGDAAHLVFADAPKAATGPTTADDAAGLGGGRTLVSMRLSGHLRGTADLFDGNGAVVRRALLKNCDVLLYTAADGRVTIPGPGELFVENHEPTTRPVTTKPATRKATDGGSGQLAISWRTSMVYDPVVNRITFDGDTVTGFRQDGHVAAAEKADVMQIVARRLVVVLKRATPDDPATKPADGGRLDIAFVQAVGGVRFTGRGLRLDCHQVIYDPAGRLMTATESADEPGETFDPAGTKIGEFGELTFDTESQMIRSGKRVTGTIHK